MTVGLLTLSFAASQFPARAHPDLDAQIAGLTLRIKKEPTNADLLIRRSEVHRWHGDFTAALNDLDAAAALRPGWGRIALARGLVLFDEGKTAEAMGAVQEFLAAQPAHADGLLLRARCNLKLGCPPCAVADFNVAINSFAQPTPDLFIERARLQASLGRFDDALQGLDQAMARLGPVPALEFTAINLERQRADFDAALKRTEKLLEASRAKAAGLLLRAEILEQAGRLAEARTAFEQALNDSAVDVEGRNTAAARRLEQRARDGLARVRNRLARAAAVIRSSSPSWAISSAP